MTLIDVLDARRERRDARRAQVYPRPWRRVAAALGLVVVVTITGLAVALVTGVLVAAVLLVANRALGS